MHPPDQMLIVTAVYGWIQHKSGSVEQIHTADLVRFSPGEKHWHGARAIGNVALLKKLNSSPVD